MRLPANAQALGPSVTVLNRARRGIVAGGIGLLCGCATGFKASGDARQDDSEGATRTFAFQDLSISPGNGGLLVPARALQTGDILLSAGPGILSAAIRAFTLAPVSHAAIYIGNEEVVEAVGSGVRRQTADEVLDDSTVVAAFRHPRIEPGHAEAIRAFSLDQVGQPYNHVGAILQAPFSIQRRICELPLVPGAVRDGCIRGIGAIQLGAARNDRFFCSQFVLEAYRRAGLPLAPADPRLVNPADLLHMRDGDIPSIRSAQALEYIGHLKYQRET